jgi:hypothetical protein
MENKYMEKLQEIDKLYEGKIIDILNNCRIAMSKADDVYLPDKVNKYKLEMIDKAIKLIDGIRDEYLEKATSQLELEKAALQQPKPDNRSTTEKLLDAINLSNTIQLNTMQLRTKSTNDLISMGTNQEDSVLVDCIKSELQNRLNTIPEEKSQERQELRSTINNMKPLTELAKLEVAENQIKNNRAYYQELLPGVGIGEKLNIGNPRTYLMQDVELKEGDIE